MTQEQRVMKHLMNDPKDDNDGYWCVVCGRFLKSENGIIVHDDIFHPENMDFNEEENEQ